MIDPGAPKIRLASETRGRYAVLAASDAIADRIRTEQA